MGAWLAFGATFLHGLAWTCKFAAYTNRTDTGTVNGGYYLYAYVAVTRQSTLGIFSFESRFSLLCQCIFYFSCCYLV